MVGDTVAGVVDHVRKAIHDDRVTIEVVEANEPSPISPYDHDPAFTLLETTITAHFPEAIVSPYVMMAATDARFFTTICDRVYRFAPFRMSKEQASRSTPTTSTSGSTTSSTASGGTST
jgi:carboxypeptidase PM20D1